MTQAKTTTYHAGNMRKRIGLAVLYAMLVVFCISPIVSWAIGSAMLVDQTAERWAKYKDYTATFVQTDRDLGTGEERAYIGKVKLCRDQQMADQPYALLEYFKAITSQPSSGGVETIEAGELQCQYFTDGQDLYTINPGETIVPVKRLNRDDTFAELVMMLALLQVDPKEIREHYSLSPVDELTLEGREVYKFDLRPQDKENPTLPRREVWLQKTDLLPLRLVAHPKGHTIQIDFTSQRVDIGLTPNDVIPQFTEKNHRTKRID